MKGVYFITAELHVRIHASWTNKVTFQVFVHWSVLVVYECLTYLTRATHILNIKKFRNFVVICRGWAKPTRPTFLFLHSQPGNFGFVGRHCAEEMKKGIGASGRNRKLRQHSEIVLRTYAALLWPRMNTCNFISSGCFTVREVNCILCLGFWVINITFGQNMSCVMCTHTCKHGVEILSYYHIASKLYMFVVW
jgi:hypothetical protein